MNIFNKKKFPSSEKIIKIEKRGKKIADYKIELTNNNPIIKLALNSVGGQLSDYNCSIIKNKDNSIDVYFLLKSKDPNFLLLGGDFKVEVSSDGLKILNKIQLHKSILKIPLQTKKTVGAFHTHVIDDLPTETDVALVLLNPKLAPHYVIGKKWMSKIDGNGKITIVRKNEELLKK